MKSLYMVWADEDGFVISAELVLVATVLVTGVTVGLVTLRNQVVQELTDVGQSIGSLSQSFGFGGVYKPGVAFTDGSFYHDQVDFCQDVYQVPGTEPGGISVRMWPYGAPLGPPGGETPWIASEGFGGMYDECPQRACDAWLLAQDLLADYPASVVRVEVEGEPTLDSDLPPATIAYKLAVWIDVDRYQRFQRRLVRHLAATAIPAGRWVAAIEERSMSPSFGADPLLPGAEYQDVICLDNRPFTYSTARGYASPLGPERIVLMVNRQRSEQQTAWMAFSLPRCAGSLGTALAVQIEFVSRDGGVIGRESFPLSVGSGGSPGLDLLTVSGGGMSANAEELPQNLGRHAETRVILAPYIAAPSDDGRRCYANRLVIPRTRQFTPDEARQIETIRATIIPIAAID